MHLWELMKDDGTKIMASTASLRGIARGRVAPCPSDAVEVEEPLKMDVRGVLESSSNNDSAEIQRNSNKGKEKQVEDGDEDIELDDEDYGSLEEGEHDDSEDDCEAMTEIGPPDLPKGMNSALAFVEGGLQDADEDSCSICLDSFTADEPCALTICSHQYHLQCILEWAQRSQECPMCFRVLQLQDRDSQELLAACAVERAACKLAASREQPAQILPVDSPPRAQTGAHGRLQGWHWFGNHSSSNHPSNPQTIKLPQGLDLNAPPPTSSFSYGPSSLPSSLSSPRLHPTSVAFSTKSPTRNFHEQKRVLRSEARSAQNSFPAGANLASSSSSAQGGGSTRGLGVASVGGGSLKWHDLQSSHQHRPGATEELGGLSVRRSSSHNVAVRNVAEDQSFSPSPHTPGGIQMSGLRSASSSSSSSSSGSSRDRWSVGRNLRDRFLLRHTSSAGQKSSSRATQAGGTSSVPNGSPSQSTRRSRRADGRQGVSTLHSVPLGSATPVPASLSFDSFVERELFSALDSQGRNAGNGPH